MKVEISENFKLGTWNHRVLAHESPAWVPRELGEKPEIYFQIHECHYNEGSEIPHSYTSDGASIGGDDIKEIKWVLDRMKECLFKPILWAGEKFPQEYKPE